MSKVLIVLLSLIISLGTLPTINPVHAEFVDACMAKDAARSGGRSLGVNYTLDPTSPVPEGTKEVNVTFSNIPDGYYFLNIYNRTGPEDGLDIQYASGGKVTLKITNPNLLEKQEYIGTLYKLKTPELNSNFVFNYEQYCGWVTYRIGYNFGFDLCEITINPKAPSINQTIISSVSKGPQGTFDVLLNNDKITTVSINNIGEGHFVFGPFSTPKNGAYLQLYNSAAGAGSARGGPPSYFCRMNQNFNIKSTTTPSTSPICAIDPPSPTVLSDVKIIVTNLPQNTWYQAKLDNELMPATDSSGDKGIVELKLAKINEEKLPQGNYTVKVFNKQTEQEVCNVQFTVGEKPAAVVPVTKCGDKDVVCSNAGGDPCIVNPSDNRGPAFRTAIGCVHTNPAEFTKDLMKFVIGIGGGLAFLMMLLGAYQMLSSAGNPETLKAGQDRLTSAVIGLLFVIFSILLLQIIGVGILAIPGFK